MTHLQPPATAWLRWDRHNRGLRLFQGLITGMACGIYQPLASGVHQSTLMIVVFVCVVAVIPALASRLLGFAAYAVVVIGPLAVSLVADTSDADHLQLVGSLALLLGLMAWMLKSQRAVLAHWIRQKHRVDELRLQLADQAAQAEFHRLSAELDNQAKTQLMAAAGHDLRQPLWALHLYGRQLRSRLSQPADVELLDAIARGLQSLDTLVSDLVNHGRSEPGAHPARLQPVRLQDIYRRLQPQLQPCAFDHGLSLRWRGGHRTVWGDPLIIERCLRNLVLNAIAHTGSGGVLVGARPRGTAVVLQVWDSGCGLNPEAQQALFDDHLRAAGVARDSSRAAAGEREAPQDVTRHGPQQGSGLGLGIVRRLTHLMGARIAVRSEAGRGTVFELTLSAPPDGQP
jgi:signal transduction histidine kinase